MRLEKGLIARLNLSRANDNCCHWGCRCAGHQKDDKVLALVKVTEVMIGRNNGSLICWCISLESGVVHAISFIALSHY
jgi:hypothetical protein